MGVNPAAFGVDPDLSDEQQAQLKEAIRAMVKGRSRQEMLMLAGAVIKDHAKENAVDLSTGVPNTKDELWEYIRDTWGIKIARVAVCEGHDAPFDFIWLGFAELVPNLFCIGPRGGGKSFDTALLMELNSRAKPGCESMVFGAVDEQNKKVYDDMVEHFINGGLEQGETEIAGEPRVALTEYINGSKVRSYPGCLTKNSKVVTPGGPVKISTIVSKKLPGPVRSFNFEQGSWEWKPVTDWFSSGQADSWLKLRIDFPTPGCPSVVTCTPGHEMLRPSGEKVSLVDMKPGEEVVVYGQRYSAEQEQVLMGLMLGDGSVTPLGRLRVAHCLRQRDYLEWFIDAFAETPAYTNLRKSKGTMDAEFPTTRRTRELRREAYPDGKKRIPDHYWDTLDALGLAIWLMDDGCFVKRPGKGAISACWSIAAMNLTAPERAGADCFFERLGIAGRWTCVDTEKDQWIWSTAGEDAMVALTAFVSDYIDVSTRQEKGWKKWVAAPIKEHSSEAALSARIESIEHIETQYGRYDITVADNHNYLLSTGLLVGNTVAKMNGQHPPKAHAEEVEIFRPLPFKESRNMAADKVFADGRRIKAQNFGTSTRKYKNGRVDKIYQGFLTARKRALEQLGMGAPEDALREMITTTTPWYVVIYCIFEIAAQVPNCRAAPENRGRPDSELCTCQHVISGKWDNGDPRTLESVCKGRLYRSRGHRSHGEVIQLFLQNDRGTWEAQQECSEAESEGLYIRSFSRTRHGLASAPLDPTNGPTYTGTDWGTTDAAAVLWVQYLKRPVQAIRYDGAPIIIPAKSRLIFAELYDEGKTSGELGQDTIVRERKLANVLSIRRWPVVKRWADIQGAGDRKTWRKMGLPTAKYSTRNFDEHVKEMRGLFDNDRCYVIVDHDPFTGVGCPTFCEQLESWRKDENGKEDRTLPQHLPSAARYVLYGMHDEYQDPGALALLDTEDAAAINAQASSAPAGKVYSGPSARRPSGSDAASDERWRERMGAGSFR